MDAAREAGHKVVPIPGASAFVSLVSVAGTGGKTLIFEGFLSPKPGRRRSRLKELMSMGYAFILYESPFRIVKLLQDIADIQCERRIVVGRELTKLHEEIVEGTAAEVVCEAVQQIVQDMKKVNIKAEQKVENTNIQEEQTIEHQADVEIDPFSGMAKISDMELFKLNSAELTPKGRDFLGKFLPVYFDNVLGGI